MREEKAARVDWGLKGRGCGWTDEEDDRRGVAGRAGRRGCDVLVDCGCEGRGEDNV